ncbi:MAG: type IV secretory system conjugative DNA transfer family protein [Mesorhizobium sp.]|uniref:type IV secretory system conjugative DNA transfer family protein n=1 Tax=Mesorhizobium sp. TaxID=1871066 RepID=UPI000FE7EAD0|nr:type IV secretory system conjugative DNA transfer family protein [Mesorhizobium sp.]RWM09726.1 MAG: type IV secretory system conjugative DNA transfer family protein [Mesorhizobium sp.]
MSWGYRAFYLSFCMVIALAAWTLFYGAGLYLIHSDPRVLQLTITTNPFAPAEQIWLYPDNRDLQIVAVTAAVPAAALAAIIAVVGLRTPEHPLGDASFQTVAMMRRRKWFRRDGQIFGRIGRKILRTRDDLHHLVIGPTRSGKGVGYVNPNAIAHRGSMIVTDLKGEIFKATAGYRREAGNEVFLFAPGSDRTHRYNPLDFIRQERGNRTTDIQNMASILVPENTESENSVWQGTAQQVIAGVISYILESPFYEGRRNFGEVNSFFNSGVNLQALMKCIKEREGYLSRFTVESFNAYLALSERAAASALLDIQKALRPFKNDRIVAATNVTDMDLRAIRRRPISIYLAPNITDVVLLRPLLTLFVQQTLDILMRERQSKSLPVYFLLDEFRQLKKMSDITDKMPYVAEYNIKMAFIIQDLKNLDEIYGETTRHSLLGNCGYQLVLGANDQATADYVSRALGKRTARYKSESRTIELFGLPRRTKVEQIRERDLMMPQEIRQMPGDKMILIAQGQKPIYGDKLRFFETEPFKSAVAHSQANIPEVPPIEYLPELPVPATTEAYAQKIAAQGFDTARTTPRDTHSAASAPDAEASTRVGNQVTALQEPAARYAPTNSGALGDTLKVATGLSGTQEQFAVQARSEGARNENGATISDRIRQAESRLKPTAEKLRKRIAEQLETVGSEQIQRRKSYLEIFDATVPDPLDLGLTLG